MRRLDVLLIGLALFVAGGLIYGAFQWVGLDSLDAGLWSQVVLVIGVIGWVMTYLLRVVTGKMTYNQQLEDYENLVLQKRLDEMTPEELADLQAEVDRESSVES